MVVTAAAPIRIVSIETRVYRVPLERFVVTSFGTMRDRPAVYVRIEDAEGNFGWGEVWCNWPACGAEHRARLVTEDVAEFVFAECFDEPAALARHLAERTAIKVLQTDERGPFQQAIAGLDTAIFDLAARRAGVPLHIYLAPGSPGRIKAYASGIHISEAPRMVAECRAAGYRAFKVKVGFDPARDAAQVNDLIAGLRPGERLMVDANQSWSIDQSKAFLAALGHAPLGWFEEPMRVDAPEALWHGLAGATRIPLAGGENFTSLADFAHAIKAGTHGVIQPDVAKWGGVSGCFEAGRMANAGGRIYCPHFLGGGIGLAASAHLLAAVGGAGLLEIDANDNPLRGAVVGQCWDVENGELEVSDEPGIGCLPDFDMLDRFETGRFSAAK